MSIANPNPIRTPTAKEAPPEGAASATAASSLPVSSPIEIAVKAIPAAIPTRHQPFNAPLGSFALIGLHAP